MNDSVLPPISAEDKQKVKENLAKPLDSVPHKASSKKSRGLLAFILVIVMAAGIAVPALLINQKNQEAAKQGDKNTLAIDTTNQEIKALIEKEFVYTGSGDTNYYSPGLDASFTVNVSLLRVSESSSSVYLYPVQEGVYTRGKYFAEVSVNKESPLNLAKDSYGSFSKYTQSTEESKDGYTIFTITYESTSLFGDKKKETVSKTYYYKKISGAEVYAYVIATAYDGESIPENLMTQFTGIISTFEYKPESAAKTASVTIPALSATVSFDKKVWELTSQYDSYANFTLHDTDYNAPYVAVNFRGGKVYSEPEEELEYAQKIADNELTYAKENKTNFKQTAANESVKIGSLDLYHSAYSFKTATDNVYSDIYYGLTADKSSYFEIVSYIYVDLAQKHDATYKKDVIKTLIQGLTFTEQKDTNVLGENTLNIEEPALVGKLGTVHIANTTCATFTINDPVNLPRISGTSKEYCSASLGTGFFITPEGHIVTNAHVASGDPFTGSTELFLGTKGEIFLAVFKEIARQILTVDPNAIETDEDVRQLAILTQQYILALIGEEKITASKIEYSNYIELDKPFDWDFDTKKLKTPSDYAKLDLIKANTLESPLKHIGKLIAEDKNPNSVPYQYTVADLALLKVSEPTGTYPAIALGDEATLLEGSSILAIGFPGVADDNSLFSESSSTTATITRGAISAVKNNPTNAYKLVQTDAAINHGNSGGPIINDNSKVIAVSTYLVSGGEESDNYGAGISVGEVRKFLTTASVQPRESEISQTILLGINNMQKNYYKVALANFDSAIAKYPKSAELVRPLKLIAQEKIAAGEDNSPVYTLGSWNIHPSDMPVVIGGLGGTFIALVILLVVILRKKPKKVPPVVTFDQPLGTMPMGENLPTAPASLNPISPLDGVRATPPGMTPVVVTQPVVTSEVAPMPVPVIEPKTEPTIAAMEQAPKAFIPQIAQQPLPTLTPITPAPVASQLPPIMQTPTIPTQPPASVSSAPITPPVQVNPESDFSESGLPRLQPEPVMSTPAPVIAPSTLPPIENKPTPPMSPIMP